MTLRQEMLNGFGMAHGGMIFAFGDTAFALACNPVQPPPGEDANITVAAGVDINFLRPAFRGQVLTAVANRRASAGRSGLYDIQIYAADPADTAPDKGLPTGAAVAGSPAPPSGAAAARGGAGSCSFMRPSVVTRPDTVAGRPLHRHGGRDVPGGRVPRP